MAEQEREIVADAAFTVVQIGVADATRLDPDERLAGPRVRHVHGDDLDRSSATACDHTRHLVWHREILSRPGDPTAHRRGDVLLLEREMFEQASRKVAQ